MSRKAVCVCVWGRGGDSGPRRGLRLTLVVFHRETQNIVMPYFLVLSSAETGKVKQIIFRFAQCLFHICWEFPLATEQNHICSWNKFILVGKQIPATSAQCFDIRQVRMITKPCNLVWMVFLHHTTPLSIPKLTIWRIVSKSEW